MLPRSPCRWLWVTIVAFIELPDNVKEKSIHFQYLVSTLARISPNLTSQHDSSEGALTRKTSTALTESAESPLYHKQVQKTKRRQRTTWSPRSREPKTMIIYSAAPQSLTPSGRGNDWRTVWGGIIAKAPKVNPANGRQHTSTLPPSVGLCLLSRRPSIDQAHPVFAM
ncbi:hypothetical protein D6D19_03337 [Aureobasidium pullulans]|uniref:Uncharacterized protein n=1 Tax=Aureobasidium pullulans TaxID=5580 RepID=A0A4S9AAE6_AURPU|nr:hypothetical protein D6D19_03337 [Aureobasidium pullulans]